MLTDHFGVDLESKKKAIGEMIQDQVNLVAATREQEMMRSHASTSRSASPAKASRSSKAAKSKAVTKKKPSTKRKAASSDEDVGENDDDDDDGEQDYGVTAAAFATNTDQAEGEDTFSELEEDTSVSRARKTSKSIKSSKASPSTSKSKKPATPRTSSGGSEAEQRLARLKKLVIECGVRKPWKKLYEAAGVADSDFSGQCQVVSNVLKELGMTGKGSIEQARKIRDQREFADELAALQENEVIDNDDDDKGGRRARRTRGSAGGASKRGGGRTITISDDSDDDTVASDFEDEASAKRTVKKARTSSAASRANKVSNSDESEDEGPTRRVSFSPVLALIHQHLLRPFTHRTIISLSCAHRASNRPSQASQPTSTRTRTSP